MGDPAFATTGANIPGTSNIGQGATIPTDLGLGSLSIGNRVFLDTDGDGIFTKYVDTTIGNVLVSLYRDVNGDGIADGSAIATSTTCGCGLYGFTGLAAGDYIVVVGQANLDSGALAGLYSLAGAGDANDGVEGDDNGMAGALGIQSGTVHLTPNMTGSGTWSVDFGFTDVPQHAVNAASVTALSNDEGCIPSPDDGIFCGDDPGGFFLAQQLNLTEDTPAVLKPSNFALDFIPTGPGWTIQVTATGAPGALYVDGVLHDGPILVSDIYAGHVTFLLHPNENSNGNEEMLYDFYDGSGNYVRSFQTQASRSVRVNDAPVGQDHTATTLEDTAYTFKLADFPITDIEGNAFTGVYLTTVPGHGSLLLDTDGNATTAPHVLVAGDYVSRSDIATGRVTYAPAADGNGTGYASFTFQVRDDGGTAFGGQEYDQAPRTFTIDVTPVNDAPTAIATEGETWLWDETAHADHFVAKLTATDADSPEVTSFSLTGNDDRFYILNGNELWEHEGAVVDYETTPSVTLGVRATDSGGASYDQDVTLGVHDFWDGRAPFDFIVNENSFENAIYAGAPAGGRNQSFGPYVEFYIANVPVGDLIFNTIDILNPEQTTLYDVRFSPSKDEVYSDTFTYYVFNMRQFGLGPDGYYPYIGGSFNLVVKPVAYGANLNLAATSAAGYEHEAIALPASNPTRTQGSDQVTGIAISGLPAGAVLSDGTHSFTSTADATTAQVFGWNLSALTLTAPVGTSGSFDLTYTATVTDSATLNGTFYSDTRDTSATIHVTIAPIDQAPTGSDATIALLEDGTYAIKAADFGFADSDGHVLVAVTIATLPGAGTLTLDGAEVIAGQRITKADIDAGHLLFTPAPGANGSGYAAFDFKVEDSGSTSHGGANLDSTANRMTFDVTAVDDQAVTQDDSGTVAENTTVTLDVRANDSDPDSSLAAISAIDGTSLSPGNSTLLASGAKVTLNLDGTLTYDPNHKFDALVSAATAAATGATNVSANDSFTYTLADGAQGTARVTVTGVSSSTDHLGGGSGNDHVSGTGGSDLFDLSQGGHDTASGGGGDDGFYFGGAFDSQDQVDGGSGNNQVGLQGDYSAGLVFGAHALDNVQMLVAMSGSDTRFGDLAGHSYHYDLTTVDANVGAGKQLTVNFNTLTASESMTFDGSAETDGSFLTYGGLGEDHLTGGKQTDGFFFGEGRWGANDQVDGFEGALDQLGLQGDYAGANAVVFGVGQLRNIDMIVAVSASDTRFGAGGTAFSYDLTMNDDNVAAGQVLTMSANRLGAAETLTFDGSAESDGMFRVYSGAGNDTILGGTRADILWGGAGDDLMIGGGGADELHGATGSDIFAYISTFDSTLAARDHIFDFAAGDRISLAAMDADSSTPAPDSFDFIGSAAFSHTAGELRVYRQDGHWYVDGDTDGNGQADLSIMVDAGAQYAWSESDFIFSHGLHLG